MTHHAHGYLRSQIASVFDVDLSLLGRRTARLLGSLYVLVAAVFASSRLAVRWYLFLSRFLRNRRGFHHQRQACRQGSDQERQREENRQT